MHQSLRDEMDERITKRIAEDMGDRVVCDFDTGNLRVEEGPLEIDINKLVDEVMAVIRENAA